MFFLKNAFQWLRVISLEITINSWLATYRIFTPIPIHHDWEVREDLEFLPFQKSLLLNSSVFLVVSLLLGIQCVSCGTATSTACEHLFHVSKFAHHLFALNGSPWSFLQSQSVTKLWLCSYKTFKCRSPLYSD